MNVKYYLYNPSPNSGMAILHQLDQHPLALAQMQQARARLGYLWSRLGQWREVPTPAPPLAKASSQQPAASS